jgi:hypothetical protein
VCFVLFLCCLGNVSEGCVWLWVARIVKSLLLLLADGAAAVVCATAYAATAAVCTVLDVSCRARMRALMSRGPRRPLRRQQPASSSSRQTHAALSCE